jgi:hypothetical protein
MINYNNNTSSGCGSYRDGCQDPMDCNFSNRCSDFAIKQHDTRPFFKVDVTECDQPIDLTGLVVEASMWFCTKLKTAITPTTTAIQFADNKGFDRINSNTIIQIGENRKFERMLVDSIDESNNIINVFRGQLGTTALSWSKGKTLKLIRFLNSPAVAELEYQDVTNLDETVEKNVLVRSTLVYEWKPEDTCFSGKYLLEFKVLQLSTTTTTSTPPPSPIDHCSLGWGVEWARRFPSDKDGFLIEILGSPTSE